ncbi:MULTISPECIES: hypothetical protein [unclassified Pseudomonas]|uniref:hypothetical protein n=1 Tax=unclassified Pseudomonas TaxID=196821 RepID=UPI0039B76574
MNIGRGAHLLETELPYAIDAELIAGTMLNVASVESLLAESPCGTDIFINLHITGFSTPTSASQQLPKNIKLALEGLVPRISWSLQGVSVIPCGIFKCCLAQLGGGVKHV